MSEQQPGEVWAHAEERYQSGQEVRGVVTRVTQFGAFVQVEPGLEGIVYTFELGSGPAALSGLAPGQEMCLYVKNIDVSRKRLELSPSNAPQPGLLAERPAPLSARQENRPAEAPRPELSPLPEISLDKIGSPALPGPAGQPAFPVSVNVPGFTGASQIVSGPEMSVCPACQRQARAGWKFCVYCGEALQRRCPVCGSTQPALPGARFCAACGRPL